MRSGFLGAGSARMVSGKRWVAPLVILAIALAALWPALVNGGPFYHPDTPSYFRAAASGMYKAFGVKSAWTDEFFRVYQAAGGSSGGGAKTAAPARPEIPVTLNGRSIYYGALLYLSYLAGSLWVVALIQSLLAAGSIYLTLDLIGRARGVEMRPAHALAIGLAAAIATPLGYFNGQLMPGIFTGIGVLAEVNLLLLWSRQSRAERGFWIAMLAYAVLAHTVNLMLAWALVVVVLGYGLWRKLRFNVAELLSVAGCIVAGLLGQVAFAFAVNATTGAPPVRPPFVAMRLIDDGPGYAYLREHCAAEHYIYCRVLRRDRQASDDLLWSKDPQVSLFRGLTPDEQRVSASQQRDFVIAVTAERPVEVMADAARNSWGQLISLDLVNFDYSDGNRERFQDTVPPSLLASMKATRAWGGGMPVRFVEIITMLLSVLSTSFLIWCLTRRHDSDSEQRIRAYCLGILAAIAINAVICGALSGPKGRYAMRLIWILPVVAAGVVATGRRAAAIDQPLAGGDGLSTHSCS